MGLGTRPQQVPLLSISPAPMYILNLFLKLAYKVMGFVTIFTHVPFYVVLAHLQVTTPTPIYQLKIPSDPRISGWSKTLGSQIPLVLNLTQAFPCHHSVTSTQGLHQVRWSPRAHVVQTSCHFTKGLVPMRPGANPSCVPMDNYIDRNKYLKYSCQLFLGASSILLSVKWE